MDFLAYIFADSRQQQPSTAATGPPTAAVEHADAPSPLKKPTVDDLVVQSAVSEVMKWYADRRPPNTVKN